MKIRKYFRTYFIFIRQGDFESEILPNLMERIKTLEYNQAIFEAENHELKVKCKLLEAEISNLKYQQMETNNTIFELKIRMNLTENNVSDCKSINSDSERGFRLLYHEFTE